MGVQFEWWRSGHEFECAGCLKRVAAGEFAFRLFGSRLGTVELWFGECCYNTLREGVQKFEAQRAEAEELRLQPKFPDGTPDPAFDSGGCFECGQRSVHLADCPLPGRHA